MEEVELLSVTTKLQQPPVLRSFPTHRSLSVLEFQECVTHVPETQSPSALDPIGRQNQEPVASFQSNFVHLPCCSCADIFCLWEKLLNV